MSATKNFQLRLTEKKKHPETVGREFANAFDKVHSDLAKRSYVESIRILRELEAEYLAQLSDHPEFALELRRRTAERSLEQALIHGCTLLQCRKKLAVAEELGWSIIDRKLHFYLLFARGMVARGHYRTAKAFTKHSIADIKRELERIESLPRRRGQKYFLDWLKFFDEIIAEIERSGIKGYSSRWDAGGGFVRNHSQVNESEHTRKSANC
jgi:hypothetical protein